jgi:hypothetical protein
MFLFSMGRELYYTPAAADESFFQKGRHWHRASTQHQVFPRVFLLLRFFHPTAFLYTFVENPPAPVSLSYLSITSKAKNSTERIYVEYSTTKGRISKEKCRVYSIDDCV